MSVMLTSEFRHIYCLLVILRYCRYDIILYLKNSFLDWKYNSVLFKNSSNKRFCLKLFSASVWCNIILTQIEK